jgi:hypothetical protein
MKKIKKLVADMSKYNSKDLSAAILLVRTRKGGILVETFATDRVGDNEALAPQLEEKFRQVFDDKWKPSHVVEPAPHDLIQKKEKPLPKFRSYNYVKIPPEPKIEPRVKWVGKPKKKN